MKTKTEKKLTLVLDGSKIDKNHSKVVLLSMIDDVLEKGCKLYKIEGLKKSKKRVPSITLM